MSTRSEREGKKAKSPCLMSGTRCLWSPWSDMCRSLKSDWGIHGWNLFSPPRLNEEIVLSRNPLPRGSNYYPAKDEDNNDDISCLFTRLSSCTRRKETRFPSPAFISQSDSSHGMHLMPWFLLFMPLSSQLNAQPMSLARQSVICLQLEHQVCWWANEDQDWLLISSWSCSWASLLSFIILLVLVSQCFA